MHFRTIWRSIIDFKMNIVVKILILSDFIIWSVNNLTAPIFAIFIVDKIPGAGIETVGIAAALYLIFKSIFEIPVGIFLDKTKGEKDDLYSTVIGSVIMASVFAFYPLVNSVWQLYLLQIILGISAAISYPGWYGIFTRHIDKKKEAYEWSVYDVALGVGMGLTAMVGAFLVDQFGFNIVFYITAGFMLIGALVLIIVHNKVDDK